jgi:8-hydroxy-5-deazaflavin:NADPH oxidoreductase
VHIGILGGTGMEARGLALRFAAAGASVFLGSRQSERASRAADACNKALGGPLVRAGSNREMLASSGIVFITVPYPQAAAAVDACRWLFRPHHILVDVTVPVIFREGHAELAAAEDGTSNAEIVARCLPDGVPLVAAFKTIPAAILADLELPLNCDVIVSGDVAAARQKVIETAGLISSLRALDGGPLRTARTLERMAVLAIELNLRYKKKGARYRIEGL